VCGLVAPLVAGDAVRRSEIIALQQAIDISARRVAEVLQEVGVLNDGRHPPLEDWLERKLDGLAPASATMPRPGCGPCATAAPQQAPRPRHRHQQHASRFS
jgi:hypothetical protein